MTTVTHPHEILEEAAATLKQRGVDYDGQGYQGGERSMIQTLAIFKAVTGVELSELDGWRFLICLKLARSTTGKPKRDTYVDLSAYSALAGEAALATPIDLEKTDTFKLPEFTGSFKLIDDPLPLSSSPAVRIKQP